MRITYSSIPSRFTLSFLLGGLLLCLPSSGFAQEDRGADRTLPLALGEGLLPATNALEYSLTDIPGSSGGAPAIVDQRESGRFIVSKTASDIWNVSERFSHLGVGDDIVIPSGMMVPGDLWSVEGGGGYNHYFSNGQSLGLNLDAGSDSDHPFYSIHETVFRGSITYRLPSATESSADARQGFSGGRIPSGAHNAWLFSVSYSNNRHFANNFPLPGVGYYFLAFNNRLEGLVGFPYIALHYRPAPGWNAQFSIFGPRNVNLEIGRKLNKFLRAYTAFQWQSQEWLIADRQNYDDRLFFDKKRVALGLRSPLPHRMAIDLSGGRQFDQRFFVNNTSSVQDVSFAGLTPAWFMEIKLSYRFVVPQEIK
jgi:hypothetical protein